MALPRYTLPVLPHVRDLSCPENVLMENVDKACTRTPSDRPTPRAALPDRRCVTRFSPFAGGADLKQGEGAGLSRIQRR